MPIVDVKGVGKAQFPDGMPIDDIRSFLQNKFSQRAINGQSDILAPVPQTIKAFEPTLTEKFGQGVADVLSDTGIISNRHGANQIGSTIAGIGEFLPGVGDATAGDEFGRAVAQGDKFGMAMAGLGVVPLAGDALKKAANVAKKNYDVAFKPLQAEYKLATADRKVEILKEAKVLRQPLDYANSQLFRATQEAKPKKAVEQVAKEPDKTFKGKVFHQTNESFDDFDLSKGADGTVWFTGDKKNFSDPASSASAASGKGRVLERDVELRKVAGFKELDQFSIGELKQQGYDGAVLDGDIQVFNKSAIKPVTNSKTKDTLKSRYPDLKIGISENADNIILDKVIVTDKSQGTGTKFMNDLIDDADSKGKTIGLTPSADFGGNKKRLTEFYKRFGFIENKGKNKDFTINETMIRLNKAN